MAARVFIVLYTKHKTQKSKKWQDGTLKVTDSKVILLDEGQKYVDSGFRRDFPNLAVGERIEFEGFLVDIDRELSGLSTSPTPCVSPAPPAPPASKPAPLFKRMRVDRLQQAEGTEAPAAASESPKEAPINLNAKRSVADILARFRKPAAAPVVEQAPIIAANSEDAFEESLAEAATPMELIALPAPSPSPSLQSLPAAVRGFTAPRTIAPRPTGNPPREPRVAAAKAVSVARGGFRPPQQRTYDVCSWQHNSFCFPSAEQCIALLKRGLVAPREVQIPDAFSTWQHYTATMKSAVIEDLNLQLLKLSCLLRSLYRRLPSLGAGTSGLMCKHNRPAVHGIVRSEGINKGRGYWACSERGAGSCKFWQWDEGSSVNLEANAIGTLPSNHEITKMDVAYLRGSGVAFYSDTVVFKTVSAPKRKEGESAGSPKVTYYLRFTPESKEASSAYSKDDLWIISSSPDFTARTSDDLLFVTRSCYHGPSKTGIIEIRPTGAAPRIARETPVYAIHGPEASSEAAMIDNLTALIDAPPPLHVHLLGNAATVTAPLREQQTDFPQELLAEMIEESIAQHALNEDQATVMRSLSSWFQPNCSAPIRLVHGVFGAGKSHLLVVIILCLSRLFDACGATLRILIAAGTNVAVDRVLLGLLKAGYTDFLRVGSLKKIAKPIYRLMCDMSSSKERIHELEKMLRAEELSDAEKALVRQELAEQRSERAKEREDRLTSVRLVGVTCAASSFPLLDDKTFDIVLLDECSQIIEPLSLLPMRFGCSRLLCVGDPLQLPPTIQNFTEGSGNDLSKALFTRLSKVVSPVILRTQYRCHPVLSKIANELFYSSRLLDGASVTTRPPLVQDLPVLSFIEANNGREQQLKAFGGSYANDYEAQVVAKLIRMLADCDVKASSIGVICLYRAQVTRVLEMLRRQFPESMQSKRPQGMPLSALPSGDSNDFSEEALIEATEPSEVDAEEMLAAQGGNETLEASDFDARDVQVSTVDAFQGAEREIVIVTSSRTAHAGEGFLDSPQRLNVALTRARRHLIVVGHPFALRGHKLWQVIMSAASEQRGRFTANEVLAVDEIAEFSAAATATTAPKRVSTSSRPAPQAPFPLPRAVSSTTAVTPSAASISPPRPVVSPSPQVGPAPPVANVAITSPLPPGSDATDAVPAVNATPPAAATAAPRLPSHLLADFEIEL